MLAQEELVEDLAVELMGPGELPAPDELVPPEGPAAPPEEIVAAPPEPLAKRAPGTGWPRTLTHLLVFDHLPAGYEGEYIRESINAGLYFDYMACCGCCEQTFNRTTKPPPDPPKRYKGQGKPIPLVLAWMRYDCKGDKKKHKGYFPSFELRKLTRLPLVASGELAGYLANERAYIASMDDAESLEPITLP